jgi:hypothetical protein
MKADIAERWAQELESGAYPQTTGALHRTEPGEREMQPVGLCCLGVLCELAYAEGVVTRRVFNDVGQIGYGTLISTSTLPIEVREWAGISSAQGYFGAKDFKRGALSALNDNGADFTEIAAIIRKNVATL